ncbi:FitA-like ribbon-helix-helix domain-containing protein [Calothrix sp. CCY 0018]|uniref:FitA-like ribbon-helix-helix domain-containing protein n=1 Tax=Calothrix sp. CCY 0018 TaxID=3103864 RepID=UPI0039C5AAA0
MVKIILENIDSNVIEKLEELAIQHGRSLQEELKYILEQATQTKTTDTVDYQEMILEVQQMFVGRTFRDSAELLREDRER